MDLEFQKYKITWDAVELENESRIPDSLKYELEKIYRELKNPKPRTIARIRKLIKRYPRNVQLKNYLSSTYAHLDNIEKAREVNESILKEHPDYFFAKINKANQYAEDGQYEKMKDLLGKGFDLKELYPDRDTFHVTEFLSMQNIAVKYYANTDDFEQAEKRMAIMRDVDEDSPQYQQSQMELATALMEKARKRYEEEKKLRILPTNQFQPSEMSKPGEFNYSETNVLYAYEDDISSEIIDDFLALDRDKIIEDLENVLKNSYYYYKKGKDNFAPVHAYFLLGELEAEESLPVVFEMMQQGEDYFEDTFSDIFTEAGWMPLMKMGKNQLNEFEKYLKLPGLYTYFRSIANDTLVQTIHHYPEKKKEVITIFENVLDFLVDSEIKDNVIDTEFNGLFVSDLIDLKLEQFLPKIKILFEKKYVNSGICGSFVEVEKDIKNSKTLLSRKRELLNVKDFYEDFFSPQEKYPVSKDDFSLPESYYSQEETVRRTNKKIGRNDPCPCNSGKKFKKCCLGKGIYD